MPFNVVDNNDFQELLNTCQKATNPTTVSLPSDKTVKTLISKRYLEEKMMIRQILQNQQSISFSTDMWTSSSGQDYMGLVAHYVNANWEHKSVVIGLEAPSEAHTGEHLAALFLRVLDDYDIRSKLAFIVCDNGSNNLTMGASLERISLETETFFFSKKKNILPCLPHVINLCVQQLLKTAFGSTATANTEMRHAAEENERQEDSQSGIVAEYERMELDENGDTEVDEDPNDSGVNYDKDPISNMRRGIFTIRYLNVIYL